MTQTIPPFLHEIIKTSRDIWTKGWAEANAGNISVRLVKETVDFQELPKRPREWVAMDAAVPDVAGEFFLVTGSGRYLRNIELYPEKNVGIIEIDETGRAYRMLWGFQPSGGPTSELLTHLMIHARRMKASGGIERAVIHTHSPNVIALTNILEELDTRRLTRLLWQIHAECVVAFPEGIEFVRWMLPGSTELAARTGEAFARRRCAVWEFHGIVASGRNLDAAFGLIDTVEKAAVIYLTASSAGGIRQMLGQEELRALAERFGVRPDEEMFSA